MHKHLHPVGRYYFELDSMRQTIDGSRLTAVFEQNVPNTRRPSRRACIAHEPDTLPDGARPRREPACVGAMTYFCAYLGCTRRWARA